MSEGRGWYPVIVGVALLVALGACATGAPAARPGSGAPPGEASGPAVSPALQRLIEAARQEGQITIVMGAGTLGGDEGMRRVAEGANRLYGLNTTVQFTPGPESTEQAARMIREYQAGRTAMTDLFSTPADQTSALIRNDALEPIDWPSWAPNIQDPGLYAGGGMAVAIETYPPGIVYNTSKVAAEAAPRSMQDLLKPEFKGRIASTPYAAWFNYLGSQEGWGPTRMTDYVARFADQVSGLMRCNEKERLLSGEFDLFAVDCTPSDATHMRERGLPINSVVPSDVPFLMTRYIAVPRRAPHPATAQLWINYLLSREGQDLLFELEAADNVRVPGSKTAAQVAALEASGHKLIHLDVDFYARNGEAELDELAALTRRLLRKQ